jgi:hypothetical protein
MPRKPSRTVRQSANLEWVIDYYLNGYKGKGRRALLFGGDESLTAYPWEEAKKELLPAWIGEHPCSRPWAFWEWDSPGPRRRVGGTGRHSEHNSFNYGIPGKAWWRDVAPKDPPRYESEAQFLQRHNLLNTAEKKHLAENPGLLEPVEIEYEIAINPDAHAFDYEPPKWIE